MIEEGDCVEITNKSTPPCWSSGCVLRKSKLSCLIEVGVCPHINFKHPQAQSNGDRIRCSACKHDGTARRKHKFLKDMLCPLFKALRATDLHAMFRIYPQMEEYHPGMEWDCAWNKCEMMFYHEGAEEYRHMMAVKRKQDKERKALIDASMGNNAVSNATHVSE